MVDVAVALLVGILILVVIRMIIVRFPTIPEYRLVAKHILWSGLFRIILVVIYYQILVEYGHNGFGILDDIKYHTMGVKSLMSPESIVDYATAGINNPGYYWLTIALYKMFGPNTILVRVINSIAMILWIIPVSFLASLWGNTRVTKISICLTAWMPSCIQPGLIQIKDPIVGLALMSFVAVLSYWPITSITRSVIACVALLIMYTYRIDVILPVISVMAIYHLLRIKYHSIKKTIVFVSIIIMIAILIIPGYKASSRGKLLSNVNNIDDIDYLLLNIKDNNDKGDGFHERLDIKKTEEIWKLPFAIIALLFIPFPIPYSAYEIHPVVAGWANFMNIILLPFMAIGLMIIIKNGFVRTMPIWLVTIVIMALMAIFSQFVLRYRDNLLGFQYIITAVGIVYRKQEQYKVLLLYFVLLIAMLIYVIKKYNVVN